MFRAQSGAEKKLKKRSCVLCSSHVYKKNTTFAPTFFSSCTSQTYTWHVIHRHTLPHISGCSPACYLVKFKVQLKFSIVKQAGVTLSASSWWELI